MSNRNQGLALSVTSLRTDNTGTITIGRSIANGVVVSEPIRLAPHVSFFSWHVEWTSTGTVTGTLTVEVSNKESPAPGTNTDWVAPQNNTFPANVSSNDSSTYEDFHQSGAKWMRLKYTANTNVGAQDDVDTLYAWYNLKRSA